MGTAFGELESPRTQPLPQCVRPFLEYTSFESSAPETEGHANAGKPRRVACRSCFERSDFTNRSCIPGSIIAALRAVSLESDREPEEVTVLDDRMIETGVTVMTNSEHHYELGR